MDAHSLASLQPKVQSWVQHLRLVNPGRQTVALFADNSIEWLAIDLACQQAKMDLIPIPTFFTDQQVHRLLSTHPTAGVLTTAGLSQRLKFDGGRSVPCHQKGWAWRTLESPWIAPAGKGRKVTFTSGSTAEPKPIVLSSSTQWQTAVALRAVRQELVLHRHLCMLPLPVLLENVAGAYACLLSGGEVMIPASDEVGLTGSSGFDADKAWHLLSCSGADSIILLPQMLSIMIEKARRAPPLKHLRLIAVGGARVPEETILEARAIGLPVYQGYGLSEACSVVSLNTPTADRPQSVGRPLDHVSIRIAEDSEILATPRRSDSSNAVVAEIHTGDLGHLDADGFLYIDGRKKNLIITSFGRNVSPEWPESLLERESVVSQCLVFGDNQSSLSVLLVPANGRVFDHELAAAVDRVNAQLPDYAQITTWQRASQAFTPVNGLVTPNGRPRRAAILQSLTEESHHEALLPHP
jgi:long-chain acyl-CoA synthetase